jgi:hypothetical protein
MAEFFFPGFFIFFFNTRGSPGQARNSFRKGFIDLPFFIFPAYRASNTFWPAGVS